MSSASRNIPRFVRHRHLNASVKERSLVQICRHLAVGGQIGGCRATRGRTHEVLNLYPRQASLLTAFSCEKEVLEYDYACTILATMNMSRTCFLCLIAAKVAVK